MPTPATTSACEGQTMGATERSNLAIASRGRDGSHYAAGTPRTRRIEPRAA